MKKLQVVRFVRATFAISASLSAVLVAACSGSSSSKPFPDVASFCAAKAKEECQIAPTCAVDPSACQGVRVTACTDAAAKATAGGTRTYNADNAQACIDAVHGVYAAGKVLLADLVGDGSMGDKCERVFQGSSDKGKACTSNFDCINNRICSPVQPGVAQSICADKISKKTTDFCADPGSVCETGSFCAHPNGSAATCTAEATQGQACTADLPCTESLRCVNGACAARQAPGQPCTSNADCSPTAGYCDPYAGHICTVGLTFATGALDCNGFKPGGTTQNDAGTTTDSGTSNDAGTTTDATTD